MAKTSESDKIAYCQCMEQIKRRLRLLRAATSGATLTGDANADAEWACLHLRKMLELIAFASLAAIRESYAAIRADFQNEWRTKRILERLQQLNPDFYPRPVTPIPMGPGRWHFADVAAGYLTQDDFVLLYDKCSDALHEWNPFRSDPRMVDFGDSLDAWASRIECLLAFHCVRLIDQPDILLVRLDDPQDGRAHVLTGTPSDL